MLQGSCETTYRYIFSNGFHKLFEYYYENLFFCEHLSIIFWFKVKYVDAAQKKGTCFCCFDMSLKLLSLNTRGIKDTVKRHAIFNFYRNKANLICLLETHSEEKIEKIWATEWGGDILFSHGQTNSRGICFLLPKGMLTNITNMQKDQCGRVLQFNLKTEDMLVTICGVYAPNNDSRAFFQHIRKMLSKGSEHKILIGDFNLVMNPQIDCIDSNHNKQKSLEVIKSMCDEFSLVDIFRSKNENIRRFSWYRSKT